MRAALLIAGVLVAGPARAGQGSFGVGVTLETAILPGASASRWGPDGAMEDVAGSTGLSCVGGKALYRDAHLTRLSVEGGYCRDLSWRIEAEWSYVGAAVGKEASIGAGRFAGGQIGLGWGQGSEFLYAYSQRDVYLRPRAYLMLPLGATAAEVGAYAHLPLLYRQRQDGLGGGVGFTPWFGLEATFYLGHFAGE